MRFLKLLLIPGINLLISFSADSSSSPWKLIKDANGIQLSVRTVPGSQVKEYMAAAVFESTLSSPVSLLEDTPRYTTWNYRCIEAKLLYRKNEFERITYMATESPWPVENRDIAVRSLLAQDRSTGIVKIQLTGLPGYNPGVQGRVRMASLNGYWIFEPAGSGKIRAVYMLHNEPGGSVPESLVNGTLKDIVYTTVWNMRDMLKKNPYRDARLSYIKEF